MRLTFDRETLAREIDIASMSDGSAATLAEIIFAWAQSISMHAFTDGVEAAQHGAAKEVP
jgi:hypothetical protein